MFPVRFSLLVSVLTAALVTAGCGSESARQRGLMLAECRLPRLPTAAQCGELEVPENRSKPDGRKIRIFTAVLPATTASPKPDPLLIIAGGPGQAASQLAAFASRLTELRRTRDVVLIDQRGTGRSSPLTCEALKPRHDDAFEIDPLPRARECAAELKALGVDAAQYTTAAWIDDLEAMREALGYPQWNVWGGSYGTRVAQQYLRRHADRIRSVTLDGVAPTELTIPLDIWRTREAAVAAIFKACEASATCTKAHPDVAASLARIEAALSPSGREFDLTDPQTGEMRRRPVTFDLVLAALQPLTYAPETASLLPELLALAEHGDFSPLLAAAQALTSSLSEQMNAALHFSVTCTEDFPRIREGDEERALANLPTRTLARHVLAVCAIWPRGTPAVEFAGPVTSDKPVLLLSGGMDPVTPPAYGATVAKGFSNSRHIVAPGYGHIVSPHACGPRLIAAFIEDGLAKLPASCIAHFENSKPPPLWINRLEAVP